MAIGYIETGLSLDRFAGIVGIHPLHFNQVFIDGINGCGDVWLSHDWQKPSAVSRESIALAIRSAEDQLEEFLGFSTYPKWYEDIKVPLVGSPAVLPRAEYITGGIRRNVLIDDDVAIAYSDLDSDTFFETATITVAVAAGVLAEEIAVYYPGEFEGWKIRPIKVSIASGVATITMSRYDLVVKDQLEAFVPVAINGLDNALFLDSVDVYRVYNDPSVQCELHGSCIRCGSAFSCASCQFTIYPACLKGEDHKIGIVDITPATWSGTEWVTTTCINPKVYDSRMWFKSGWTGEPIWDLAVAYLALSQMPIGLCACPTAKAKIDYWAKDTAHSTRDGGTFKIPKFAEECPWGYSRGAMFAYSLAAKHKMAQGRH